MYNIGDIFTFYNETFIIDGVRLSNGEPYYDVSYFVKGTYDFAQEGMMGSLFGESFIKIYCKFIENKKELIKKSNQVQTISLFEEEICDCPELEEEEEDGTL
jgi:hypothetical protein